MTVTELQALVLKLQSQINQLELTNKGANKALEFRLEVTRFLALNIEISTKPRLMYHCFLTEDCQQMWKNYSG